MPQKNIPTKRTRLLSKYSTHNMKTQHANEKRIKKMNFSVDFFSGPLILSLQHSLLAMALARVELNQATNK